MKFFVIKMEKENLKKIWIAITLGCIGLIIGMSFLIFFEIKDAKKGCEELEGEFYFNKNIFQHQYYCDGEPIYRYSNGRWNYEIDYDNFIKNLTIK